MKLLMGGEKKLFLKGYLCNFEVHTNGINYISFQWNQILFANWTLNFLFWINFELHLGICTRLVKKLWLKNKILNIYLSWEWKQSLFSRNLNGIFNWKL